MSLLCSDFRRSHSRQHVILSSKAPKHRRAALRPQRGSPRVPLDSSQAVRRRLITVFVLGSIGGLGACQSAYYAAMEKVGYEKRDILSSRVEAARDSQEQAKQELVDALTAFSETVNFEGGELESRYKSLAGHLADSEAAANDVRQRVQAVSDVGEALFSEWQDELEQYRSGEQ